jgi:hypothetical protein
VKETELAMCPSEKRALIDNEIANA